MSLLNNLPRLNLGNLGLEGVNTGLNISLNIINGRLSVNITASESSTDIANGGSSQMRNCEFSGTADEIAVAVSDRLGLGQFLNIPTQS